MPFEKIQGLPSEFRYVPIAPIRDKEKKANYNRVEYHRSGDNIILSLGFESGQEGYSGPVIAELIKDITQSDAYIFHLKTDLPFFVPKNTIDKMLDFLEMKLRIHIVEPQGKGFTA